MSEVPITIEQGELLPELPDDGLLMPDSAVRHVFTAERLEKRHQLRRAVVMLLAAGYGVDLVARELRLSSHTVRELRARWQGEVAGDAKRFGELLMRQGARWIGLAQEKEAGAQFRDLVIGAGIVIQRGGELAAMGEGGENVEAKAVGGDLDPAVVAARIRALLGQGEPADQAPEVGPDVKSGQESAQVADVEMASGGPGLSDAKNDALGGFEPSGPAVGETELERGPAPAGEAGAGGGGGSEPAAAGREPFITAGEDSSQRAALSALTGATAAQDPEAGPDTTFEKDAPTGAQNAP